MKQSAEPATSHIHSKRIARQNGAYYTPQPVASLMAHWIVRHSPDTVLEPSFGDGSFLVATERAAASVGIEPTLLGSELQLESIRSVKPRVGLKLIARQGDFLTHRWCQEHYVSAVLGNPPFVRLRHLTPELRSSALAAAHHVLCEPMDPSGSTWMPFVLHAAAQLDDGGCLALVLPYEATHVRYARPLWRYLGRSFGRLRVVRSRRRIFSELLQDVIILLAEKKSDQTGSVEYQVADNLESIDNGIPAENIDIDRICDDGRPFLVSLLPESTRSLLANRLSQHSSAVGDIANVRIGYVSGDKEYFHPKRYTRSQYQLPQQSLHPALCSSRSLRHCGLFTSSIPTNRRDFLWQPLTEPEHVGDKKYILVGVDSGVNNRYKCKVRKPWYLVPSVERPSMIMSVFGDYTRLAINDGQFAASNSFLSVDICDEWSPDQFAMAWYSSIGDLYKELAVHSLGGGVMVAVPREVRNVRVPNVATPPRTYIHRLDRALGSHNYEKARDIADEWLRCLGIIDATEHREIRSGVDTLRAWRRRR
ncbi:MAG: N-6 DNA methylase [Acidimicrobiaceae bacterium]|nr:N-6 DNA methylase [Acidimicrobiaceae bacterium]